MNEKKIRKWLEALRSGKYKQTRGKFKGKRGFCCLGVGGELGFGNIERAVCVTMGIAELQYDLTDLNDKSHYSFGRIADWVERKLDLRKGKK